jgi:hypothetical protein
MDAHQAKTEANHEELVAAVKANQKRMEALLDVSLEMMELCLEKIRGESGKSINQDGSMPRRDESGCQRSTGGPIGDSV